MNHLTKQQAVDIFGTASALAAALGLTKGAVSQWPESLDTQRTAAVIGAAVQSGRASLVPPGFICQTDTDEVLTDSS